METVLTTLKTKYVAFEGRAARKEYWLFVLFQFVVIVVSVVLDMMLLHGAPALQALVGLALFLPALGLGFRRMHDIDKSAWWLLLAFVPFVGAVVLLVFACLPGTVGSNQFGADPKGGMADTTLVGA